MSYNNNEIGDVFSRTINAAFNVAAFNKIDSGLQYTPPKADDLDETLPASLRDALSRKKKNDPWSQGWHGGFPPGAGM